MLVVCGLDLVTSYTSVTVYRTVVMSPDGCPVDHAGSGAPPRDRTVFSLVNLAVTVGFSFVDVLVQQLGVVFVNVALQVGHAW